MARTLKSDKLLFIATLLLVSASVVMVYSASAVQAQDRYHLPSYWFLVKQLAWAAIGFGLLRVTMRVDYHVYRRPAIIWSLLGVVVLALLAVFLFHSKNSAQRWITLPGISLQPSELAKLAAIFFAAALLDRHMQRVNDFQTTLLPIGVVTVTLGGLIVLEPDFGTATMVAVVVGAVLFAAGLSYRYVIGSVLLVIPAAAVLIFTSDYRMRRVLTFLDPSRDPLGAGYQINQSLIAIGSGGALGKGLMAGVQKLYYLPEPHNDFIYAVIAEELGLIGTTLVLLCFAVIAWRGLRASLVAPDRFGSLLAVGLTAMIGVQALINISVVTGLVPNKGIPLPLVSNGGSSLLINLVAMGILLNISQRASPTAMTLVEGQG